MSVSSLPQSVNYRVRVAVPVFLYDLFDYQVTAEEYEIAEVGARVAISFGRQQLVGVIMEKRPLDYPLDPAIKLKSITALLDQNAVLSASTLKLATWAAEYYQFPIGEVVHSTLPTRLRQGKDLDLHQTFWLIENHEAENLLKRSIRQQEAYQFLLSFPSGCEENELQQHGFTQTTLKVMADKGILRSEVRMLDFVKSISNIELAEAHLHANQEQQHAIDQICSALNRYQAFLLDGLTGSGKTEIYLQAMHEVLKQGKQVLVLVPEIGLTPQTIQRFQSRFQCEIALLHSGLNENKRLKAWHAAQSGKAAILLGTRSALFTPLPHLGLIILDEEHDLSFKQQEGFRYHARDVALYRGYLEQCPVILGSATPSIDSYALVDSGKMIRLVLSQRAANAKLPKMHLIDLKVARKQEGISQTLIQLITEKLNKNEQVLIFLNRRGFAPVLICESCAWQAKCPHCDAHFTVHQNPYHHLHCHHCGTIHRLPNQCPSCQHNELKPIGLGTAKVEQVLQEIFPNYPVIRVDRDSTSRVGSWQKIYEQIHENKPIILLGTQMLAKGHHFPHVTLVAILDVDSGLLSVDFRAPERTAQLIMQVAGRAGRGDNQGEVFIQTLLPDHPLLNTLITSGYQKFALETLAERKIAQMPPYRYAIMIRCESKQLSLNQDFLSACAQQLRNEAPDLKLDIWGPIPAPMERKAGKFHSHMILLSNQRAHLHFYVRSWWKNMLQNKPSGMKLTLDVDPQELS